MYEGAEYSRAKPILARLFSQFIDALLEEDYDRAIALLEFPATVVSPYGPVVLKDADSARELFSSHWAHWSGEVSWMRPRLLDIRSYTPALLLVDIEWFLLDNQGHALNPVFTTYSMRESEAGYRMVGIVSHNEVMERPAGRPN